MAALNRPLNTGEEQQGNIQPMQVVINEPVISVTPPDESVWYWLACIFCNCCGLSAMALTLHCVAQGLYEQGASHANAAQGVWRKARKLRNVAVIASICIIVLYVLIWVVWIGAMFKGVEDMEDTDSGGN